MPNTYTQIHIHFVFVVKYRKALIDPSWKDELHKYIIGIVQNNEHKALAVNAMPDHVHLLVGLRPSQSISDLMQDVKGSSSKWINEKGFVKSRFEWQSGYGAFACGKSDLTRVIRYIQNQEQHHKKQNFNEEYRDYLRSLDIDYEEKYLFEDPS
jgi:REP element-mobilizing transposase RayT